VLEAVEVLFEATGSYVVAATVPVLVRVPGPFAVTTIVSVVTAFLASVPTLHVTTPPDWLGVPEVDEDETYVQPEGRLSLVTTP
jgi:hypothetical protein